MMHAKRIRVTDEDIAAMRSWIEDTFRDGDEWLEFTDDEYGPEEANALILRGVERHYQGGVREFVACSRFVAFIDAGGAS